MHMKNAYYKLIIAVRKGRRITIPLSMPPPLRSSDKAYTYHHLFYKDRGNDWKTSNTTKRENCKKLKEFLKRKRCSFLPLH